MVFEHATETQNSLYYVCIRSIACWQQRGFLGLESVRGDDGIGITVSYWTDHEAIQNWGRQAEHVSVQAMGRQEFYQWYRIRVAEVFTDRSFMSGDAVVASPVA